MLICMIMTYKQRIINTKLSKINNLQYNIYSKIYLPPLNIHEL